MNKARSASEELIDTLLNMTPEQLDKFLHHPVTTEIMGDYVPGKAVA